MLLSLLQVLRTTIIEGKCALPSSLTWKVLNKKPLKTFVNFRHNSTNQLLQPSRIPKHSCRYISRRVPPKTPDLIYVPRITRWLMNKVRLKMLQRMWDPEFSEGAFIYGATKAVCKITEIIHRDQPDDLKNLVTIAAAAKLKSDMSRLSKLQKDIIELHPNDIKMLIPISVNLDNKPGNGTKNCKIGMRVLALKWFRQVNGVLNLVLVALQTEFLRDYTEGVQAEWTISAFDVLECTMLQESDAKTLK